eukprot:CAMPEP_0114655738 /NCGR_PEP_ID=MMETSP0191-20121206/11365_1 /TAXON_ID=126664 /ORGANISM="Sorites sp." /LENGTH=127 /DNA_ID=CAMNT_0001871695 /DNA_START=238 /DNA_END=618 /DNA_ORIENTATION=+
MYRTSDNATTSCTKGAWISLYENSDVTDSKESKADGTAEVNDSKEGKTDNGDDDEVNDSKESKADDTGDVTDSKEGKADNANDTDVVNDSKEEKTNNDTKGHNMALFDNIVPEDDVNFWENRDVITW